MDLKKLIELIKAIYSKVESTEKKVDQIYNFLLKVKAAKTTAPVEKKIEDKPAPAPTSEEIFPQPENIDSPTIL